MQATSTPHELISYACYERGKYCALCYSSAFPVAAVNLRLVRGYILLPASTPSRTFGSWAQIVLSTYEFVSVFLVLPSDARCLIMDSSCIQKDFRLVWRNMSTVSVTE